MNPGDKVRITRGIYEGSVGELIEYKQNSQWSTPYCRIKIPGFNFEVMIDPWDVEPVDEDINETDSATATNL